MAEAARAGTRLGVRKSAAVVAAGGETVDHQSTWERAVRGALLALVVAFFMFPIFWILLMSFQTNDQILRIPPSLVFEPTMSNYKALITGRLVTAAGALDIAFMKNLWNSILLSTLSVALALLLGVPAAYAFARYKFRLGENIAFTLLSFRFAPPLLVLLPLALYFRAMGLADTYIGLIWVYQLICLPLILWIVRGYFEDVSPDIEYAYRIAGHSWWQTFTRIAIPLARPGIAAAGLLAFIFAWNNFVFALVLASADKQPVTVGALAFVTASGIQYGQIAAAIVLSITPTLLLALYAQRYLVQGLSLGAVKG
jgi:multiple sugar transport system permease protein